MFKQRLLSTIKEHCEVVVLTSIGVFLGDLRQLYGENPGVGDDFALQGRDVLGAVVVQRVVRVEVQSPELSTQRLT